MISLRLIHLRFTVQKGMIQIRLLEIKFSENYRNNIQIGIQSSANQVFHNKDYYSDNLILELIVLSFTMKVVFDNYESLSADFLQNARLN